MAYSARSLSTNLLEQQISQASHGFTVGQVLRFTGATYVLAEANSQVDANTSGMVSFVIDANTFGLTQAGYISQLPFGVVPGQQYYLSPTVPGGIQLSAPSTAGQYIVALFIPDSTSSGYYFNNEAVPVSSAAPDFIWSTATVSGSMLVNHGYIINSGGLVTLTLPPTAIVGSLFEISGFSSSGWTLAQNNTQILHMGIDNTTSGVGGSVSSTQRYDTMRFVCAVANTDFAWLSGVGNLTIV
jgi:hypothetical protein